MLKDIVVWCSLLQTKTFTIVYITYFMNLTNGVFCCTKVIYNRLKHLIHILVDNGLRQ